MRSFGDVRQRPAPRTWSGQTLDGRDVHGEFTRLTLVVAVKGDCLGCRGVFESDVGAFGDIDILVVARTPSAEPWWSSSSHRVVVSPALLDELDVRWPPFYVVIDPDDATVVGEGVVFGPEQVREEISPLVM